MKTEKLHWERLVELGQDLVGRQLRSRNNDVIATVTDVSVFLAGASDDDYDGLFVNATLDPGQGGLKYWPSNKINLFADVDTDDLIWELVDQEYTNDLSEAYPEGYVANMKTRRLERELQEAHAAIRQALGHLFSTPSLAEGVNKAVKVLTVIDSKHEEALVDAVNLPASETGTHH